MTVRDIVDLRTALAHCARSGQAIDVVEDELDPRLEIAAHFAEKGTGVPGRNGRIANPTIYARPRGYDIPILLGLLGRRSVCSSLLGFEEGDVGIRLSEHVNATHPPQRVQSPPCQENVVRLEGDRSVADVLPLPTFGAEDAGPYVNMGVVLAEDPDDGTMDITFHRLCYQGGTDFTIYLIEGRHIERMYRKAAAKGRPLPASINIGLDPAIHFAATFSEPITPLGFCELNIAGAVRGAPVSIAQCKTVAASCIANAEIVIEGEITAPLQPENRAQLDGNSLGEFLGYMGKAQPALPVFRAKAIALRSRPIFQCLIGPGSELSNICGLSTEACLFAMLKNMFPGKVLNCYSPPSGGGKLSAVIQVAKTSALDDAVTRQIGLSAFSAFHELKHVFLVDDDVDLRSESEVLWALNTRFQGEDSIISIPHLPCHGLDPSQQVSYTPNIRTTGTTWKTVFDCTFPHAQRRHFQRA